MSSETLHGTEINIDVSVAFTADDTSDEVEVTDVKVGTISILAALPKDVIYSLEDEIRDQRDDEANEGNKDDD